MQKHKKIPNDWFRFKQFTIQQKHAAMKVGTDGVLLGAWATVPKAGGKVLDIGTGTGLIALMIAQRTREVEVDALEIDPSSAQQARENFRDSPWKERLHCIQFSFQDYALQNKRRYDLIICNPPFYTASAKTPSKAKNLARHDDSLSLEDLFRGAVSFMNKTSLFSIILPFQKEAQAMNLSKVHQLFCKRITRVVPTPGKSPKRLLLEFSFSPGFTREDELTIETETRHRYTDGYRDLTNSFYL